MKNTLTKRFLNSNYFWYLVLFVLMIPSVLPYLKSGFFHFSDEAHIANLHQMVRAIESGQIPPRWVPDVSYNFGHPLFNFYYPLPYYLGSLFYFAGSSLITSIKFVSSLSVLLSGIFMFSWIRRYTSNPGALAASLVYIYAPYRAVDLYVRGALGENLAFLFFPLVALTIDKVVSEKSLRNVGMASLVIGLFIISHNLAPLIFIPWFLIYALIKSYSENKFNSLKYVILSFALGVLISGYWSIPAFIERVHLVSQTPFNFMDHFPFIKQLIYSPFRYGASLPGPNDDISFQIGFVNLGLVVFLIYLLVRGKLEQKSRLLAYFLLLSFFICLFLMNIRSAFLWNLFPLANYVQFPWRILMVTTFIIPVFLIFLKNKRILIFTALLAVFLNINYFKPNGYFYPDDDYFLNKMFVNINKEGRTSEVSEQYANYSEDYLLLPEWIGKRPDSLPVTKFKSSEVEIINQIEINSVSFLAEVSGEGLLEFNSYYFPGWYASVDGKDKEIEIIEPYGKMGIKVQSDDLRVKVYWAETPLRLIFDSLSLMSLVFCIILILAGGKHYGFTGKV